MKENQKNNNQYLNFDSLGIDYSNNFNHIKNWKLDKTVEKEKVTKIEVYNYINRCDVKNIIKFLNTKKFKYYYDTKSFFKLCNVMLNLNNKHISWQWNILDSFNLPKYYYYVDFVKVLNHRWRPLLLKIYRNESCKKQFSKIEITYFHFKKWYNLYFLDWLNSFKSINEIIKKINKRFQFIWYDEDFSLQQKFDDFIIKMINKKTKHNKSYKNKIIQILNWKLT